MEIEYKYLVPKEVKWDNVISNEFINKYIVSDSNNILNMMAYYFDTVDHKLSKAGLSFRVRYENDEIVCTTKYGGAVDSNGLHRREEINVNVSNDFFNNPCIDVFKDYEVYGRFIDILGDEKLVPLIKMEYVRKECNVSYFDTNFVMSIDEGKIITPNSEEGIYELEIELSNGDEAKLQEFGDFLKNEFKLLPFERSKLERGMKNLEKK